MALALTITPAGKVIGSMPAAEVDRTPVLLGLDAEDVDGDVKFLVNVAFQGIWAKAPPGMGHWYIAATDAQITLRADGAKIVNRSKGRYIDVKHTIVTKKEAKLGAEVEPKIEVSEDLTVSLLKVGGKRKRSEDETIEYSEKESQVGVTVRGDSVVWIRSTAFGRKAILDFIVGNLNLWIRCKWATQDRHGSAELRTFPVFFNAQGKQLSKIGSFVAAKLLNRKALLANEEGVSVRFTL